MTAHIETCTHKNLNMTNFATKAITNHKIEIGWLAQPTELLKAKRCNQIETQKLKLMPGTVEQ